MTAFRKCPVRGCRSRPIRGNILWRHLERTHGLPPERARELAAEAKHVDDGAKAVREAMRTIARALRDAGKL